MSLLPKSATSFKSLHFVPTDNSTEVIPMAELKIVDNQLAEIPIAKEYVPTKGEFEKAKAHIPMQAVPERAESRASTRRHSRRLSQHCSLSKTASGTTHSAPLSKTSCPVSVSKHDGSHKRNLSNQVDHVAAYERRDAEMVCGRLPSCSSLPHTWTKVHDRFIAYLATHAPLTREGKIPLREELKERWSTVDILKMLKERFPRLRQCKIRVSVIEERLEWLDESGNDYFGFPYGAYKSEEWGKSI